MRHRMSRGLGIAALAAAVLAATGVAIAAAQDGDGTFELAAGVTHDGDLFAAGERVRISGTVEGNLFAGGAEVVIDGTVRGDVFAGATKVVVGPEGTVEGDVMAGGTQVDVAGTVEEDVRAAGYIVRILDGARVGGEIMVGGFSTDVEAGAEIGDDVYAGGFQVAFAGSAEGDANLAAQSVELSGRVGGDAVVEYGDPNSRIETTNPGMMFWQGQVRQQGIEIDWPTNRAPGLALSDDAEIGGALTLRGPTPVEVPDDVVAGDTDFQEQAVEPSGVPAPAPRTMAQRVTDWIVSALKLYLALLLVGALAVAVAPRLLSAATRRLDGEPLPSAGWGCLTQLLAIAGLIALVIALVLVGIVLGAAQMGGTMGWLVASVAVVVGVLLTFGMVIASWAAQVAVGLWLGRRATGRPEGAPWLPLAVGLIPVALLVTLPAVGGLFKLLAVSLGLGALVLTWYRARSATEPPAEALAAA